MYSWLRFQIWKAPSWKLRLLVGDEARLVALSGRVALQVHAAVVGVDTEDDTGVGLVVGAGVEGDDLDVGVLVVLDRAVVLDDAVEDRVLLEDAVACGREFGRGQLLREDLRARTAFVLDRQHRVAHAVLKVTGVVLGAVRLVELIRHLGEADPERGRAPSDLAAAEQLLDQRLDGVLEFGVLEESAEFTSGVAGQVGLVGAEQIVVGDGEVTQSGEDTRVGLHGFHEFRQLVAAEQHGVGVVDRREHSVELVVRRVVVLLQTLDHVEEPGVLSGAVDQGDRLGQGLSVGLGDIEGVGRAEEAVQGALNGALQRRAVFADVLRLVVLDVVGRPAGTAPPGLRKCCCSQDSWSRHP